MVGFAELEQQLGSPREIRPRQEKSSARVVPLHLERSSNNGPQRSESRAYRTERLCLYEHIADRGRLDWASEHRYPQSVRYELAQQFVL